MRRVYMVGAVLALAAGVVMTFEGLETGAYIDPVGIPTICYGHTTGVLIGDVKTDEECKELLQEDLLIADAAFTHYVTRNVAPKTKAALLSFIYNVGAGNFARSTLLLKLNKGQVYAACNELLRWTYAGGRRLEGLVRRREAERALCLEGWAPIPQEKP